MFAYLLYSLGSRAIGTTPQSGSVVFLLLIGALLPDLIDKPLSWQWHVVESGMGLAHSIFWAIPLCLLVIAGATHLGTPASGIAFGVGYLSHLIGDLLPRLLRDGELPLHRILWPVIEPVPSPSHRSFVDGLQFYFGRYLLVLRSGELDLYVIGQLVFVLAVIGLWIVDGMPGVR